MTLTLCCCNSHGPLGSRFVATFPHNQMYMWKLFCTMWWFCSREDRRVPLLSRCGVAPLPSSQLSFQDVTYISRNLSGMVSPPLCGTCSAHFVDYVLISSVNIALGIPPIPFMVVWPLQMSEVWAWWHSGQTIDISSGQVEQWDRFWHFQADYDRTFFVKSQNKGILPLWLQYSYLLCIPLLMAYALGNVIIKYHEGFVVIPFHGSRWSQIHRNPK